MWKQYDRTHVHTLTTTGASAHVGGLSEFSFFLVLFLRFRLQCSLVLPWFMMGPSNNTQLHTEEWRLGGLGMEDGRGAREPGHYSRPAEQYSSFVLVASDINIFGTLPNWQGKLFVRPPTNQPEQEQKQHREFGSFFWCPLVPGPQAGCTS